MSRLAKLWSPFPTLPKYTGPYTVGIHDYEFHPTDQPSQPQDYVLVRFYYPATAGDYVQPHWLPTPVNVYGRGYGNFVGVPWFVSVPFFTLSLYTTRIPAFVNAPLAGQSRFPVLIFSHGLGGNRSTYSSICGDLASRGFVVCAVEHRDGSASTTYINQANREFAYIRPQTSPGSHDEYTFRRAQLEHRMNELQWTWQLLTKLNAGSATFRNCLEVHGEGDERTFDRSQWIDRLDLTNAVMAGHSFGGATTILACQRFPDRFKCALALDAWMFPLFHGNVLTSYDNADKRLVIPTLAINSAFFSTWRKNMGVLRAYVAESKESSTLVTIKDTGHQNQSDFPLLYGNVFGKVKMIAGILDPHKAMYINNALCLAWIQKHLPSTAAIHWQNDESDMHTHDGQEALSGHSPHVLLEPLEILPQETETMQALVQ